MYEGTRMTPWESWPTRLASTRCRAMRSASCARQPAAWKMLAVSACNRSCGRFMVWFSVIASANQRLLPGLGHQPSIAGAVAGWATWCAGPPPALAAGHPEYYAKDGVHFNAKGIVAQADAVARSVLSSWTGLVLTFCRTDFQSVRVGGTDGLKIRPTESDSQSRPHAQTR